MVQWGTFHRLTTFSVLLYIRHLMPILPSFDGSVCSIWRPCNSDLTLEVIIRRLDMAHLNVCNHQLTDDILFCSSFDVDEIVTWRFICLIWWSCNLQLTRHLQFLIRPFISLSWSVDDSACLAWQFCFFHLTHVKSSNDWTFVVHMMILESSFYCLLYSFLLASMVCNE